MQSVTDPIPKEFRQLLSKVGRDFALTQGLGGNSSYKEDGFMHIKASGMRLKDVDNPDYFFKVGVAQSEYFDLSLSQHGKPSIEVFMHALFSHKFVLHLHSTMGVALSMVAAAKPEILSVLDRENVCLLPYARPGESLKQSIKSALVERDYSAFILQNHGVLYFANSSGELADSIDYLEGLWVELLQPHGDSILRPDSWESELTEEQSIRLQWHAKHNWRISPDHCVFLGSEPTEWLNQLTKRSAAEIMGLDTASASPTVAQEQLLWFVNVAINLPTLELPTLSFTEAEALRGWEAEKHRVLKASTMASDSDR